MNNRIISCGQLFVLMFIIGMTEFIFFFPVMQNPSDISSSLISFLIAAVFQIICLLILIQIRKHFVNTEVNVQIIPQWLNLLYGLFFIFLSLRSLNGLLMLEDEYADPQMNKIIFMLLFTAACIYAATGGTEAVARFSFFVFLALFIAAILFLSALFPIFDSRNIQTHNADNHFMTFTLISQCVQPAALFLLFRHATGKFRLCAMRWIIFSTIFFLVIMILTSGSIADYVSGMKFFAVHTLDSAGTLQRFRPFYIAVSLGGMFCYLSVSFTLVLECLKTVTRKSNHTSGVFVILCTVLSAAVILLHRFPELTSVLFGNSVMIILTFLFSFLFPGLFLIYLKFRKRGRLMKKTLIIILSLLLCSSIIISLTGCSALQLNQRIIIQGLGIDYNNNECDLTAIVLNTEDKAEGNSAKVVYSQGKTPLQAIKALEQQNGQSVLLSQCLFLILDEEAVLRYRESLDYFIKDNTVIKTMNIMSAQDSRELITTAIQKYGYDSEAINRMSESKAIGSSTVSESLFDVISCMKNGYRDIQIPFLRLNEVSESLHTDGSIILSSREEKSIYLSEEETKLSMIINKQSDKYTTETNGDLMEINNVSCHSDYKNKQLSLSFLFDVTAKDRNASDEIYSSFREKINKLLIKTIKDEGTNIYNIEKGQFYVQHDISRSEWNALLKNCTINVIAK